ncbi:MAG: hypothetical protein R2752_14680 [Vicinamibacterales bacterium]
MTRRVLFLAWLAVGVAVWNGFFDLYVSRGARECLQRRAEYDAGLAPGPAPAMAEVMATARHDGLIAASAWAVLVTGLGLVTLRRTR